MTLHPRHAFDVIPGERQPSLFALFFRPLMRLARRKPATPEPSGQPAGNEPASGAATALLANRNAAALGSSFRVSLTPEEEAAALAELGQGVLGNRMISEVRAEEDRRSARPAPRPVPPGWGTAWRDGVRILVPPLPVPGRPPWDTAPFAPVPPQARRPVNGRSMPSRPRRQPVYGEAPQLEVERAAAQAAGERARERYEPASVPLLRQVLDGLRCLDVPAAGYRGGWQ